MLLGIVVHVTVTYSTLGIFPQPIKDPTTHIFYDFIVLFIHAFRMPVFFVLSGFFTALLYEKKGVSKTMTNRINRILLPFLAAMLLIAPLVKMLIMHYAKNMRWVEIWDSVKNLTIYINMKTGHLWFLYYLMMVFVICHLIKQLKPSFFIDIYNQVKKIAFANPQNAYKTILFFSMLSACFIIPQQQGLIDTSICFIPDLLILFTYLVYFIFGYMLFSFRENLEAIFANWQTHLSVASVLAFLYFFTFLYAQNNPSFIWVGLASFLCSLLSWLMIFGLLGLFLYKLSRESKILTFISKSSYWSYLMHLPLTILLGGLFIHYNIPHVVKAVLIMTITYIILIFSYKLLVERTFIGQFLNGKKH